MKYLLIQNKIVSCSYSEKKLIDLANIEHPEESYIISSEARVLFFNSQVTESCTENNVDNEYNALSAARRLYVVE